MGFEPTRPVRVMAFQAIPLDHSGTSPKSLFLNKAHLNSNTKTAFCQEILMKNGDVKQLWDMRETTTIIKNRDFDKILFLGDILFGYGEFVENNHKILPSGYVEEWWSAELEECITSTQKAGKNPLQGLPKYLNPNSIRNYIKNPFDFIPPAHDALAIALNYNLGIHPRYLDHWGNVNGSYLLLLRQAIEDGLQKHFNLPSTTPVNKQDFDFEQLFAQLSNGLEIPKLKGVKECLEHAFVVHQNLDTSIKIYPSRALVFIEILGFGRTSLLQQSDYKVSAEIIEYATTVTALELFQKLTTLKVPDKAPYYMGSRMGRPEKAKERKMRPPVQALFPLSNDSKLQRSLQKASGRSRISIEICQKQCPKCNQNTFLNLCPKCGTHTEVMKICKSCNRLFDITQTECPDCKRFLSSTSEKKIALNSYYQAAAKKIPRTIPDVKGVKGMTSEYKIPEPIEKGILRAINEVWVYKDGTIRADATDIPLTHFTCKEIKTPVKKIRELGYDVDIHGQPITQDNQIIELRVQDILLTDHIAEYFIRVAKFVDDELEYIYHQPRFYNITKVHQLIGHYMAGLAPHTSAAIIGRVIGVTRAESGYAHPFWHAGKRRNCDGDEDGIMLLLECLLNFSKFYLPSTLGGKMDAPLVVSVLLDPREVDGESHNCDYMARYPLQFYLDSQKYVKPTQMEKYMVLYKHKLDTPAQFEGAMFTHPTESINFGPRKSSYSLYETMKEKVESQLFLAKSILAVDAQDVARKVISSHFAPDVLGNLRAFSTQSFRCPKCSTKYRRVPLVGKCTKCGNDLLLTVHAGGIVKYLPQAKKFIHEFNLGHYTEQRWNIIERNVKSLTNNPKVKQISLKSFFK